MELEAQGQQLNRVEAGLTRVEEQTNKAGHVVEEMEASQCCWGCCVCCWPCWPFCPRRRAVKRRRPPPPTSRVTVTSLPKRVSPSWSNLAPHDPQEEEIHQGLDAVCANITTFHQQAVLMSDALDTQNAQLDHLHDHTQDTTQHMNTATGRVQRLLQS